MFVMKKQTVLADAHGGRSRKVVRSDRADLALVCVGGEPSEAIVKTGDGGIGVGHLGGGLVIGAVAGGYAGYKMFDGVGLGMITSTVVGGVVGGIVGFSF